MGRLNLCVDMKDTLIDRFNNLPKYAQDVLKDLTKDLFINNLNDLYYFLVKERKIK